MVLRNNLQNKRAAFTLMEIIVVVAIILILASAGVVVYSGVLSDTDIKRAKMDITNIQTAVLAYEIKNKTLPPDLRTLTERQLDNSPALLKESVLFDPWKQEYVYEPENRHDKTDYPHIYSAGPPGKNTPISNWDQ